MSASGARFGAEHRLHTPADYATVFNHRRVLRGDWFNLHYRPGIGSTARLGLVVAKKQARRAVQRNLLKRIARDAFRQVRAGLPTFDLVLRLAKPVVGRSDRDPEMRRAWRTEFEALLSRLPR